MDGVPWRVDGALESATVRGRPNRFVVAVDRGDGPERAHLSNPGELAGLVTPGATVYCRPVDDADRATALDVGGAEAGDSLVYLPSAHATRAFRAAVERDLVDRFRVRLAAPTIPVRVGNETARRPPPRLQGSLAYDGSPTRPISVAP
jgi:DNA-binding sugar fermentation-stimulating protein